MPVPTIYIDASGIHAPDYPAILESLQEDYRRIFGQDAYIEPDSQDGQLLAIFAKAIADTNAAAVAVYMSFSPATAQGVGLSQQVKINGIRRLDYSYSTVDVLLVAQPGTVITNGQVKDENDLLWLLPKTVNIPLAGEVTVTATAQYPGDIRAAAGSITRIATPTRGWQSVTNPLDAVPGRPVEQDATLRRRQSVSTALPSSSIFEGIIGAVATLPGVTRWRGYENDQSETDANGLPGHSIALVVEGGDATAIAQTIAGKKTPGTYTFGTTAVHVTDEYGVPNTIRFFRPDIVPVAVQITIRALPGYLSTTGDQIKRSVAAYVNSMPIGEDVLWSKLYVPANLDNLPVGKTFDILSLALGRDGQPAVLMNMVIGINEAASLNIDDITLIVED